MFSIPQLQSALFLYCQMRCHMISLTLEVKLGARLIPNEWISMAQQFSYPEKGGFDKQRISTRRVCTFTLTWHIPYASDTIDNDFQQEYVTQA